MAAARAANEEVFPTRVGVNRRTSTTRASPPRVFPTRVGVNRRSSGAAAAVKGIPHACGGEPSAARLRRSGRRYSPRVWG